MATTCLIAMHQNKGKSIADCLADRTDYAKNPDKTNDGELLSSYECDPKTVQGEFMLSKRQYDDITGRNQAMSLPIRYGKPLSRGKSHPSLQIKSVMNLV